MTTERFIDDKSDLGQRLRLSTILQALSPAVAQGSNYPEARPGDFLLCFEDGSEKLVSRAAGVTLLPIMFLDKAVEWPPDRGSRSAPIDHHDFVPADAEWIDVGGKKACIRSSNGNRIEKTIYVPALVDGFKTTFAFKSMAYAIAQDFGRDADKVRVEVDGEAVRVCGALWKLTSELKRKNTYTWYGPRFEKLGILGQATGPALELVKMAKTLRFEMKVEEERQKKERAALSAVPRTPTLGRGTMSITSGLASNPPRSWADPRGPAEIVDPKPAEQAPKAATKDPNDEIDSIPWT